MIIWAFPCGSGCACGSTIRLRVRFGAAHSGYRLTITIPNAKFGMARCIYIFRQVIIGLYTLIDEKKYTDCLLRSKKDS